MQAYRPRNRPANLTLSESKKALRSDAKDPLLFCPSRTPTSARFSQSEFSSDAFDLEVRRNTVDLQTGAIFNNDIVIETDSLDTSYNSSIYDLYSSKGVVYGLPSPPTNATLVSELHQQFAGAHNGAYPKVGLFTQQSEVKDDGAFNMENEGTFSDSNSSDEIDSPLLATQEEEVPLATSFQPKGEDEEDEKLTFPLLQHKRQESRSFSPISDEHADEDAEGDDDDDYSTMNDFSGKEDDDGSDDDFVNPSLNALYNQQRRTLAQFEKKESTRSLNIKIQIHTSAANSNSLPTKYTWSSSPSPASTTPPSSAPSSAACSSSSRKRKARPSSNGDSDEPNENNGKAEDPDSPSLSNMYTIIREGNRATYQCNLCPEVRTKAFGDMKRHFESRKHKPPSYRCDPAVFGFGCGKFFTRNDALKRHMLAQHPMQWAVYEADNMGTSRKRVKST